MQKAITLLLTVFTSIVFGFLPKAGAENISSERFFQIKQKYADVNLVAAILDPNAFLYRHDLPIVEHVYLKTRLLNKLALEKQPNLIQQKWVEAQQLVPQLLSIPDEHHFNQPIVIVNIANTAMMVSAHWQAYAMQKELSKSWKSGHFSWMDYFSNLNRTSYMGLTFWFDDMSQADAKLVVEAYLANGIQYDDKDNRHLSLFFNKTGITPLLDVLWERKSDQYSHRLLQNLSNQDNDVSHIIDAASNPSLASQALFSLMKFYNEQPQAQTFIRMAIEDKQLSDTTVGMLSLLEGSLFRETLLTHYHGQPQSKLQMTIIEKLETAIE